MNRLVRSFALAPLAAVAWLACASGGAQVAKRPEPESIITTSGITAHREFRKKDCAKAPSFDGAIAGVKRIAIRFAAPRDGRNNGGGPRHADWALELQTALLRAGYVINDEKERDEFRFDDEGEKVEVKSDAYLCIDTVEVRELSLTHAVSVVVAGEAMAAEHPYRLHVGALSGRLVLANNDVLWSGSVCVTSLDLAASAEAPAVSATATRAYRFSEKLRAWVADKWELATRDNFSASFADWQADHHRRALIRHAVNEFLGGLK
ncbi:MAG TPA: hypothetical protein PKJ16_00630 [Spirochaetota bacterium]|nr:hypothetical protein [Spirochaetota bacterium]HPU87204.1 hypothetical protein [Spirochaetota bacterium]